MNETTFLRANQDRIVLHSVRSGWRVTYYAATALRGSWLRRLFAPGALFQEQVGSPAEVHTLLLRHGLHLTRAEAQRLNSTLNLLATRSGPASRSLA